MNNKLVVILGPTASGKSKSAVKLAKKFNGEIVSADSRQVYKGLDIGSGKITKEEMQGVPHYLLNVANPKRKFTVSQFQKLASQKIREIQKRGKLPFLVGGTGFYIQSVVDGITIPEVKPNWKLRKMLAQKSTQELFLMLKKLDPRRAKAIDSKNPRRLIRAIEIIKATSKPIPKVSRGPTSTSFEVLQLGIKKSPEGLKWAIHKRLEKRLKIGMVAEVKHLYKNGLSWKRLEELGLEYRFVAQWIFCNMRTANVAKYRGVFRCPFTYQDMINKIQKESEHFASRQRTWFKRDPRIKWVTNYIEASKTVKDFLDGR